jgi:rhodanese-related sulfurtransferase
MGEAAKDGRTDGNIGYAGDLSARDAWTLLETDKDAVLVDVRSRAEWTFVGVPALARLGKAPLFVAWQNYATSSDGRAQMIPNGEFAAALVAAVPKTAPVVFICRSGGRSRAAAIAATGLGYARAYNLAGGFEGDKDSDGHRGHLGGWKVANLPWTQE